MRRRTRLRLTNESVRCLGTIKGQLVQTGIGARKDFGFADMTIRRESTMENHHLNHGVRFRDCGA